MTDLRAIQQVILPSWDRTGLLLHLYTRVILKSNFPCFVQPSKTCLLKFNALIIIAMEMQMWTSASTARFVSLSSARHEARSV